MGVIRIENWRRLFGPGTVSGSFEVHFDDRLLFHAQLHQRADGGKWIEIPDGFKAAILEALKAHLTTAPTD